VLKAASALAILLSATVGTRAGEVSPEARVKACAQQPLRMAKDYLGWAQGFMIATKSDPMQPSGTPNLDALANEQQQLMIKNNCNNNPLAYLQSVAYVFLQFSSK
jgi:hypothetical protein